MGSVVVSREDIFPVGATVNAYRAVGLGQTPRSGAPTGSSAGSGTVASNGSVTIDGLVKGATYILYAATPDRYLRAVARGSSGSSPAVAVGTSPVLIQSSQGPRTVIVQNAHASQILYVDDNDQVSTANGLKIAAGASVTLENWDGPIYGIASGAATDTRILEAA